MMNLAEMDKKIKETKPKAVKAEKDTTIYKTYEDFDPEKLYLYAGLDCITTSTVLAKIFPKILEEPVHYVVGADGQKTETRLPSLMEVNDKIGKLALDYILDLEINGLKYDVKRNKEISEQMVAEIADLDEKIFGAIGRKLNLDSAKEVTEYLYTELGLIAPATTKSGDPSTDGSSLLILSGLDPLKPGKYITPDPSKQFLAWMAKRKDINSTHNTFIRTYVKDFVKRDGRIHPSYNLHGTSSFRITGDNPNLTQLPRNKHGYSVRQCYTVEEGFVFIAFDFSSAEVKILATLCKDPNMMKACREGLDFHSTSASLMAGISYEEFIAVLNDDSHPRKSEFKNLRQVAKVLTFSILYGSSAGGIAMQLNISKDEAESYINLFFKAYPKMKEFIDNAHKEAMWNKRVTTPFGQRRQEYGAYPCFSKSAVYNASLRNASNVKVQSPTSTLGLIVFAHLNEAMKKAGLGALATCTVYDSCEWEVPIKNAAKAIEMCFHYMNDWPVQEFDWLEFPIGVEGEIGFNWGDLKTVHRGVTQEEVENILKEMKEKQ